jgi:hypothetical protein
VLPVPQCPGGHVAGFSLAKYWPGRPLRWPLFSSVTPYSVDGGDLETSKPQSCFTAGTTPLVQDGGPSVRTGQTGHFDRIFMFSVCRPLLNECTPIVLLFRIVVYRPNGIAALFQRLSGNIFVFVLSLLHATCPPSSVHLSTPSTSFSHDPSAQT